MSDVLVELRRAGRDFVRAGAIVKALDSVSCTVRAGDSIAVVGPSGGGKSTLLQLMAGIDDASTGTVSWPAFGPRATLRPKSIGLVFQTQSLLATLSVSENVAVPLLLAAVAPAEAAARARIALERFELLELAEKLPEDLSGGQAQRVAFARAVVGRPRLILADEPTGQLDRATAERFLDLALAEIARISAALVLATHDPLVAARLPLRWQMAHGSLSSRA